jgi:hypothetical protein
MSVSHSDLVEAASRWLVGKGHVVVTTELTCGAMEQPDAIGWKTSGHSTLIECKASRSDFAADKRKATRRLSEYCVGDSRYYLVPRELVAVTELPDGWGLIYYDAEKKRCRVIQGSESHQSHMGDEVVMLVNLLRRVGTDAPKGIAIRAYTIGMKIGSVPRASLVVTENEEKLP